MPKSSPLKARMNSTHTQGFLPSHYVNQKDSSFSNQYSNVWLMPNEMMYHDTSLKSYEIIQKRQQRQFEVSLERKKNILQKTADNIAKEELVRHYYLKHGVKPNKQQRFFLSPLRLRDLLIQKAKDRQFNKAASRIQNWFLGRIRRRIFLEEIRRKVKAICII